MGKKILKVASLGLIGGKKKKKEEPVEGQPIITPLDTSDARRKRNVRRPNTLLGDISSGQNETLGG